MSGLKLYKQLMRAGQQFQDYNFRSYTIRRVRDAFKAAKDLSPEDTQKGLDMAKQSLELIRRQATLGQLYHSGTKLSIEQTESVRPTT